MTGTSLTAAGGLAFGEAGGDACETAGAGAAAAGAGAALLPAPLASAWTGCFASGGGEVAFCVGCGTGVSSIFLCLTGGLALGFPFYSLAPGTGTMFGLVASSPRATDWP